MNKEKVLWGIAVVGVLLGIVAILNSPKASSIFGAAGGMLAENYIPYIRYNDGYKSENEIVLSGADGDITTGDDISVTDDAVVTDDLTVNGRLFELTSSNTSTSSAKIGCYETAATSTATKIRLEFNTTSSTSTINGQSSGMVAWSYGSCPI